MMTLTGLLLLFLAMTLLVLAVLGAALRRRVNRDRRTGPPAPPAAREDT
jgi:hypothetical protein